MDGDTGRRPRLQSLALVLAVLLCLAFVASFIYGLRRAPAAGGAAPADMPMPAGPDPTAGRVEVLNASGRSGLARHVTSRLRGDGFDVVFFGNAPQSAGDSSVVLDRTGRTGIARAVADAVDIDSIRTQLDSTLYLDATVILGTDWSPVIPVEPAPPRSGWRRALDWIRPGR